MTRTFRYALTAVLSIAVVLPAIAQDNFPDVPDNHWAYDALKRMKSEGLLVGYPDGLFRGNRPATRYEMAVAIHATYVHLRNMIDNLNGQMAALQDQMKNTASQSDLANLKAAVDALQSQVNSQGQDIADLKKMADTFEKELASLGVDVQQMKKDLGDLADRVTDLENRLPVNISGSVDWVMLAGYGADDVGGVFGVTVDGRPTGVGRGSYSGQQVGATRDLTMMHEMALTLTSARKTGPKFRVTTVVGNMLGQDNFEGSVVRPALSNNQSNGGAFGNQSNTSSFVPFGEGQEDVYIQNASVSFDTSVYGLGFGVEAGRVGYKVSPYIFQRPDVTPYFANDRWDNGEWSIDGAVLGFHFGGSHLDIVAGRTTNPSDNPVGGSTSVNGVALQPLSAGRDNLGVFGGRPVGLTPNILGIDQMLGANLHLPLMGDKGGLNLAYLWLDSNTVTATSNGNANRVTVFGGDGHFSFGSFLVNAGYSQSDLMENDKSRVTKDNKAWYANVGLEQGKWGINAGYRAIDPRFAAPGDWGRIGMWWNPVDIEGYMANAHYNLSGDMRLVASAEGYRGRDTNNSALVHDDKLNRYTAGLEYKMASNYNLSIGVEDVRWDLSDATAGLFGGAGGNGKALERWYNLGFGWSLSDNAKFNLLWQVSDYKALELPGFAINNAPLPQARGGLITTQLSVKF
jgi:hypothetical protein